LFLKPYWQSVSENWNCVKIENEEVLKSAEYKNLNLDIETLCKFNLDKLKYEEEKNFDMNYIQLKKLIKSYQLKIERDTEIKFRQFIKKNYFFNKSIKDKDNFLDNNKWLERLYPACKLRDKKIKVVISSTKKFFSKIDTFSRMPFYIYNNNSLLDKTVTFIDEFDTTKETLLEQIIDDGLKFDIDIFALFLNIYYSLTNLDFPKSLTKISDYRQERIIKDGWKTIEIFIEELRHDFKAVYQNYHFEFFTKSKDFNEKKAFIFDDGKTLNILNDNSKKVLQTMVDKVENNISLYAETRSCTIEDRRFDKILKEVKKVINGFISKAAYISKNYTDYKNQSLYDYQTKYTFEESVMTVLSAFNISDEFKQYLFDKILDEDANLKSNTLYDSTDSEYEFMRKGFEYTEIEDDHNHDLQTKAHAFKFETTPENILIKLSMKSRVIGISATASIDTVIGNYDQVYIKKILRDNFYNISNEDRSRLKTQFRENQKIYSSNQIKIITTAIDDIKLFSDKEKCIKIINFLFNNNYRKYYLDYIEQATNHYQFLIICKLLKLYKEVTENKNIYSFLAFLNSFPIATKNEKEYQILNKNILEKAIQDLSTQNNYNNNCPILHIVKSETYKEEFVKINNELANGKKVFVLSTYKTIGNGKNIQYEIPKIKAIEANVIRLSNNNNQKDFDAIYLSTPTNLIQVLSFNSENKVNELCKYIFQQEYLYQKGYISHSERKNNLESGFRKTFFGDKTFTPYKRNQDILLHTTQLIIQAIGRICRCKNKNKKINIFYDQEVLFRLNIVKEYLLNGKSIFNAEFEQLLNQSIKDEEIQYAKFTNKNKEAFREILIMSKAVRKSETAVKDWQCLRNFVLKNPTSNFIPEKYKKFYFELDTPCSGYSYRLNKNHEFTRISFHNYYEQKQVSAEESELIRLMNIPQLKKYFEKSCYATKFESAKYIMSESLYNQIYKGALGEAVGKYIIDTGLGYELEDLEKNEQYEAFDFKVKNLYFDFKHWNYFIKDNDGYSKFIKWKLDTVNGDKAIIINLFQRGNHNIKISVDDKIIQVPYLINDENEIDYTFIEKLDDLII